MSVNQKYSVELRVGGVTIPVTNLSLQHTLGSSLPTASATVAHADYVFVSNYGDGLAEIPFAVIQIIVAGAIAYTYNGVVTNINGSEDEIKLENTLTIVPTAYFATVLTSSFSGVGNAEYLDRPFYLMSDIISYFNTSVFNTLGIMVIGPVFTDAYELPLSIAPRFMGMTCYDMLSEIARCFGLSVYFTWDNQAMISSIMAPIQSDIYVARDMMKTNNFALDIPMAIYGSKDWTL